MARLRRALLAAVAATAASTLATGCGGQDLDSDVVSAFVSSESLATFKEIAAECATQGIKLRPIAQPKSADDVRLQFARRLTGNDRTLDIMSLDNSWTAEFASAGWTLPVPDGIAKDMEKRMLAGPLATARLGGRLVAVPLYTNTQLLWYRKDVLQKLTGAPVPPAPVFTWDQLLELSKKAHDQQLPAQIAVPAAQYEGGQVWFISMLESAGGRILSPDGKASVLGEPANKAAAVTALRLMKQVATAPGHAPGLTQFKETEARLAMERGDALFELNWPFVLASMQQNATEGGVPFLEKELSGFDGKTSDVGQLTKMTELIRQKFDFAPYPRVDAKTPARSTIGGTNLGVASTSRHPELAWRAIQCMTSDSAQRLIGLKAGTPPVLPKLYDDPEFQRAYPMASLIRDQLQDDTAAVRPLTPQYTAMSTLMQASIAPVGSWEPDTLADELVVAADKAIAGKGLVP